MPAELPAPQSPQGNILRQTLLRARLIWRLMRDRRVSFLLKLIPVGGVAYVLFPLDLIMDMVPVAGQVDDAGIMLGSLWLFVELCPADVVREHWDDLTAVAAGKWQEVGPKELPEPSGEPNEDSDLRKE
jgi:uncharacterized membrane protein YkvA (DUF1232 family)